jgi:TrmH family RNA methyltransferase
LRSGGRIAPVHERISSPDNALVKRVARLVESGRARREARTAVIDGAHLVDAFMRSGQRAQVLFASDQGLASRELRNLFERCPADRRILVTDRVLERMATVETPTGLLALIGIPTAPPTSGTGRDAVWLDGVQDAGNVGSILRSAGAVGVQHAVAGRGTADLWSPKVLRAAMGAHFAMAQLDSVALIDLVGARRKSDLPILVTSADGECDLYDADLREPAIWVFGAEGAGVSAALREAAALRVRIPMAAQTESLNVAVAAAVCLFEQARQRRCRAD